MYLSRLIKEQKIKAQIIELPHSVSVNKISIEAEKGLIISGQGIKKNECCGNLNCYIVTAKALLKLKKYYTFKELCA